MNGKEVHELLGAYLLGGLDDADRLRFEEHLTQCGTCRRELSDLESLPGLLDALPVPDAVALAVPAPRRPGADTSSPDPAPVPVPVLDELSARRRNSRRPNQACSTVRATTTAGFAARSSRASRSPDRKTCRP